MPNPETGCGAPKNKGKDKSNSEGKAGLLGGFPDEEEFAVEVSGDWNLAGAGGAIDGGAQAADAGFAEFGDGNFDG